VQDDTAPDVPDGTSRLIAPARGDTRRPIRALITGASQGIGLAIAERLAAPGGKLALCASAPSARLTIAANRVAAAGAEPCLLTGDLADPAVPEQLLSQAVSGFGGLDCLVANAAERGPAQLHETSLDSWQRGFDVNVRSTWLLAVAAYGALRESRGSLIAIGSASGVTPHPGFGAYSASKAALSMLVRQLAMEWAADGIRVNSVNPGFTVTPRTEATYRDERLRDARLRMVPMGRWGRPEEIAAAVAFFASSDAAYCTGQSLAVDGGLLDSLFAGDPGLSANSSSGSPVDETDARTTGSSVAGSPAEQA
jgi:glucose 1-dehydrogenase